MNKINIRRSNLYDSILSKSPASDIKKYFWILLIWIIMLSVVPIFLNYIESINCEIEISKDSRGIYTYAIINENELFKIKSNQEIVITLAAFPNSEFGHINGILQVDTITAIRYNKKKYYIPVDIQFSEEIIHLMHNTKYYGSGVITIKKKSLAQYIFDK